MSQAIKFLLVNIHKFGVRQVADTLRRFKVSCDAAMLMIGNALRGIVMVVA